MDFFEINQLKKDISMLLDQYLTNFDDSYHQIYSQYFFKLDMGIQKYLNREKKSPKTEKKKVKVGR